ncbi:hypothetical protein OAF47_00920 [bacterium]|nr:hypothetical protein [bacterium]
MICDLGQNTLISGAQANRLLVQGELGRAERVHFQGPEAVCSVDLPECGMQGEILKMVLMFLAVCCVAVLVGSPVNAEEPAREFLDGLRDRGYHDTALEYLESLETSRLVPADMRDVLGFETALTLVDASRASGELAERYGMLNEAQTLLRKFIDTHGSHPRMYAARSQLGNLIVERARIKVGEAKTGNAEALKNEARKLYDQAFKECGLLEAAVTKELDLIPKVLNVKDREEAKLAERRKQLRADNLQTELLAAAILEESADTVAPGSKARTDYLVEAASLYDAIYKKYRSRLAGLYARMYQGRCNHRLGRTKDALGYYGELLDQPSAPEPFWNLKTKTLRLAMDSWLDPQQRKYVEAIKQASGWVDAAPRSAQRSPDLLAIRLSLALAQQMQAEEYENRQSRDVATIRNSYQDALKNARFVAAEEGELQDQAMELVLALGGRVKADPNAEPETFAEAQKAGKKSLDEMGVAGQNVARLQALVRRAKPADQADALQQLKNAQMKLSMLQVGALDSYRLAMQLADRETPPSELNLVRYFVCYLYYLTEQYHEAAVIGDFVSRRYSQSAGAKQCAKIALACYLKMLEVADDAGNAFEIQRIVDTTRWIAEQWEGTPESQESLATVVPILVNADALVTASEFAQLLPKGSQQRALAELVTGQAMWAVQLSQQSPRMIDAGAQQETPPNRGTTEVFSENDQPDALQLLLSGYEQLPEDIVVDASLATAVLSLAQALVANDQANLSVDQLEGSQAQKAVEVLENETVGPLTLIDRDDEAAKNPIFVQESLRTALQAYVASMDSDPVAMMEKAQQTMTALRGSVGADATGKKRMLAIYITLARTIESKMIKVDPRSRKEMSGVFESFLGALSADASDPGTLNWVAETFASLGSGFDTSPGDLNMDAAIYYDKSINAFQNLLNRIDLTPGLETQIRARLAAVKAKKRDFQGAMADMEQLLQSNPSAVNLQIEAARLLQRWGSLDSSKLTEAITGIRSGEKGGVWGWGKIANATMPHAQFREQFFEARYEIAVCQFALAMTLGGSGRSKQLAAAEKTLGMTSKLYPSLGGDTWAAKYEKLTQEIQRTEGASK